MLLQHIEQQHGFTLLGYKQKQMFKNTNEMAVTFTLTSLPLLDV